MKLTWIGQAGFLLEWDDLTVMIDPYLSDSCAAISSANHRRIPVDERLFLLRPDVIVTTHDHLDHYDPETLDRFLDGTGVPVLLGSAACWARAKKEYAGKCNPVYFAPYTRWTQGGVIFESVHALHSEPTAIGVIIRDGKNVLYFSGDTLYNANVLADLPKDLDVAVLPVNGKGNNMNFADAADFATQTGAKKVVPVHVGLFDDLKPENFVHPNAWYLKPFETIEL